MRWPQPSWLKSRTRANPPPTRDLYEGTRGPDVVELQERLVASGCLDANLVTGYFGPVTKGAMVNWQEAKGLPASGFYGPTSRQLMEELAQDAVTSAAAASATAEVAKPSPTVPVPVVVLLVGAAMIAAHQTYLRFFQTEKERYRPRSSVSLKMLEAKRLSMEGTGSAKTNTGRKRAQRPKLPPNSKMTQPSKPKRSPREARRSLAAKVERLKMQVKEEQASEETHLVKASPRQTEIPRLDVSIMSAIPQSRKKTYILPPRFQLKDSEEGYDSAGRPAHPVRNRPSARSRSKDLLFGNNNGEKGNNQWPIQHPSNRQDRISNTQGNWYLHSVDRSHEGLDMGALEHRSSFNFWSGARGLQQ